MGQLPSVSMSSTCISVHALTALAFMPTAVSQWNAVVPIGSRHARRRALSAGVSYLGLRSRTLESLVSALVKSTRRSWWGRSGNTVIVAFKGFWSALGRARKRPVSASPVAGSGQQPAAELGRPRSCKPKAVPPEGAGRSCLAQMEQTLFFHCCLSPRAKQAKALA